MSRNTCIWLQLVTYGMLVNFIRVCAIFGKNVRNAHPGEFPFVVSISKKSSNDSYFEHQHFCSGTLVSEIIIITAAHCTIKKRLSDIVIIAGSHDLNDGVKHQPQTWITYHEWKHKTKETQPTIDDIAVIILKGDGVRYQKIPPAPLIPVNFGYLDSRIVKIAGWGETETGTKPILLRMAELKVLSNEKCSEEGTKLRGKKFTVPPNYFCSFAKPFACSSNGDSGAPILDQQEKYLVGINVGVCPAIGRQLSMEERLNSHIRLQYYQHFINYFI